MHKSVKEVSSLDEEELLEWEAFDKYIEPVGGRRIDVAAASINKTLVGVNTTDKDFHENYTTLDFVEGHIDYKGLGIKLEKPKPSNPVIALLATNKKHKANKTLLQDTLADIGKASNTEIKKQSEEELKAHGKVIAEMLNKAIAKFETEDDVDN